MLACVAATTVTECFERPESGTAFTLLSGVTHPARGREAVDASVIPTITSGPVQAAVLAIAETFAAEIAPKQLAP